MVDRPPAFQLRLRDPRLRALLHEVAVREHISQNELIEQALEHELALRADRITEGLGAVADRLAALTDASTSPVSPASSRSSSVPACDTTPAPSAVTFILPARLLRFTYQVPSRSVTVDLENPQFPLRDRHFGASGPISTRHPVQQRANWAARNGRYPLHPLAQNECYRSQMSTGRAMVIGCGGPGSRSCWMW